MLLRLEVLVLTNGCSIFLVVGALDVNLGCCLNLLDMVEEEVVDVFEVSCEGLHLLEELGSGILDEGDLDEDVADAEEIRETLFEEELLKFGSNLVTSFEGEAPDMLKEPMVLMVFSEIGLNFWLGISFED